MTHYKRTGTEQAQTVPESSGGLPTCCCFCKKMKTKDNRWKRGTFAPADSSRATVSHGICPDCAKEHYPDYLTK